MSVPKPDVAVTTEALQARIGELAESISDAYPEGLVLVAVLKGSLFFLADLVRQLTVYCDVDFLSISKYAPDTGRVKILKDLDIDIHGRVVVMLEDIADTGLSLSFLRRHLLEREPVSVDVCVLFDKTERRIVPVDLRFVGFPIDDRYLLGYGMDFAEQYRNVDHVMVGDLAVLQSDQNAYRSAVYRG